MKYSDGWVSQANFIRRHSRVDGNPETIECPNLSSRRYAVIAML